MGNSWGHTLTPFTQQELDRRDDWAIRYAAEHPDAPLPTRPDHDAEGRTLCTTTGKCRNPARWWATYRYVTGRAGRVSDATKPMCDHHADGWRKKYNAVEKQEATGRPTTGTQAIVLTFLDGGSA